MAHVLELTDGTTTINLTSGATTTAWELSISTATNTTPATGGVTVYVTANVANDLDVQSLAYRIADVISRRRR